MNRINKLQSWVSKSDLFEGSLMEHRDHKKNLKNTSFNTTDSEKESSQFFRLLEKNTRSGNVFCLYKPLKLYENERTLQAIPQSRLNNKKTKSQGQDAALQNRIQCLKKSNSSHLDKNSKKK